MSTEQTPILDPGAKLLNQLMRDLDPRFQLQFIIDDLHKLSSQIPNSMSAEKANVILETRSQLESILGDVFEWLPVDYFDEWPSDIKKQVSTTLDIK